MKLKIALKTSSIEFLLKALSLVSQNYWEKDQCYMFLFMDDSLEIYPKEKTGS
jgi:hypothetical protein